LVAGTRAATEGAIFYGGYGAVQTGKHYSDTGDFKSQYTWEGLAQSMAFGVALKAIGGITNKVPGLKVSEGANPVWKFTKGTMIDGAAFAALSPWIAGIKHNSTGFYFEPGEYTIQEVLQSVAMAGAFR
jgi:hypothetical protein